MKLYELLGVQPGVTAIIGSGGKSTTLRVLAQALPGTVLLCTSTHFMGYPDLPTVLNPTEDSLRAAFRAHRVVCAAAETAEGKLVDCGLPYALLQSCADYVIVEADGSKRLPLKAHAGHEPVIPKPCGRVVCVVGLSGLGKPISESVHRPELFCARTGAKPEDTATPRRVAQVLLEENIADVYFLNQVDIPGGPALAQELAQPLQDAGKAVIGGSLQKGTYQRL